MEYDEKRDFVRVPAECKVSYRLAGSDTCVGGDCVNISGSGILFRGISPLEPGRAAEVRLIPDNPITPPLTAYIEVVRCLRIEDGRHDIGGAIKGIKSE